MRRASRVGLVTAVLAARAMAEDHLVPERGAFGWMAPDAYEREVAQRLVGDLRCELATVSLPSFRPEHALCVTADGTVIVRTLDPMLWGSMMRVLEERAKPGQGFSLDPESMTSAMASADVRLAETKAALDSTTLGALHAAWTASLRLTRYPARELLGRDGRTTHFSAIDAGCILEGWTWSPPEGSAVAQLVELGLHVEAYAQAPEGERKALAAKLRADAMALTARLGKQ